MNDITILIKTFLRKKSLFRLLKSIENSYSDIPIVIVDDGDKNLTDELTNKFNLIIKYFKLPFDSGLSYGRNYGLSKITTKYFLLLDDDFVFTKETDISKMIDVMKKTNANIVGGGIRNYYNFYEGTLMTRLKNFVKFILLKNKGIHNYYGNILEVSDKLIVEYFNINNFHEYLVTDICLNFFLGDVKKIKDAGGWNNKLKIGEHTDFFIRMKENNIKVVTTNLTICNHYPIKTKEYQKYRDRTEEMTRILFDSRNLIKQISIFKEKNLKIEYFFENNRLLKNEKGYR